MIIELTRGRIRVKINEKIACVSGEMLLPEDFSFGFVVYLDSIQKWEKPNDNLEINEAEKQEIIDIIKNELEIAKALVIFD